MSASGAHATITRCAILLFFISLIFDTGRHSSFGGVNLPFLAGAVATTIAFMRWQMPRDSIVRVTMFLIMGWVVTQWIVLGASLIGGVRVIGVFALALAIAGTHGGRGFAEFQLRAALIPSVVIVGRYYWGTEQRYVADRLVLGDFGPNNLATMLAVGVVLLIGAWWTNRGVTRWLCLFAIPWYLPPLWLTGSRKALALLILSVGVGLIIRNRRNPLLWMAGTVLAAVVVASPAALPKLLPSAITESARFQSRYVEYLESDYESRRQLIDRGIAAVRLKPISGHGLDAPRSDAWLAAHIGRFTWRGQAIMTHNGMLDYAIMGGLPLLVVMLLLFGRVIGRVWRIAVRHEDGRLRNMATTACMLAVLFIGTILFGNIYSKVGWWMFGFCLLVIRMAARIDAQAQASPNSA